MAALADLGYTQVEDGQDLPLYGYRGDRRPETAGLVVRREHIGSASNDLGFARSADGYFPIISDFDQRTLARGPFPAQAARRLRRARRRDRAQAAARQRAPHRRRQRRQAHGPLLAPMPEIEFTIDTATGELQMHVQGIAGPACDDVARLVKELAGEPSREEATAEYHLRPRVHSRGRTRGSSRSTAQRCARTDLDLDPATGDLVVEGLEAEEALALAGDLLPHRGTELRPATRRPAPLPVFDSVAGDPSLRVAGLYHASVVEGPGRAQRARRFRAARWVPRLLRPGDSLARQRRGAAGRRARRGPAGSGGEPRDGVTVSAASRSPSRSRWPPCSALKARGLHTTVYTGYTLEALGGVAGQRSARHSS